MGQQSQVVMNIDQALWPWNYLPYIIFHNGGIFLHDGLLPHLMSCSTLITRRLSINELSHQCHISKSLWWFASSEVPLWKPYQARITDCGLVPLRSWPSNLLGGDCIMLLLIINSRLMILSNNLPLNTYPVSAPVILSSDSVPPAPKLLYSIPVDSLHLLENPLISSMHVPPRTTHLYTQ
jgi:hypothetical protein